MSWSWSVELSGLPKVAVADCGDLLPAGGVYVVYRGDEVVYVGLTTLSLERRLRRHRVQGTLLGEALEAGGCDLMVRVLEPKSPDVDMGEVEWDLIRAFRPSFNTAGIPRDRLQGEAAERYCRRRLARLESAERGAHRDRQAELAVGEFKGHYGEAERQALAYIYRAAGALSLGEELDAGAVGEEAYRLFLEALRLNKEVL